MTTPVLYEMEQFNPQKLAEQGHCIIPAAKRLKAMAPDREMIEAFAIKVSLLTLPALSKKSRHAQHRVEEVTNSLLTRLQEIANSLYITVK